MKLQNFGNGEIHKVGQTFQYRTNDGVIAEYSSIKDLVEAHRENPKPPETAKPKRQRTKVAPKTTAKVAQKVLDDGNDS